ncbi:SsrA-binding protein [Clostridium argentinense CDC 2741]|uniref:SsrA-binding protein n=1 Tax=Clostridium argentinense CDC 2741 TaxID=1418104 RepID=A0A0C1UHF0_9CLOT|nr:SsrA-binding protein SmpB [Clostridium argentinense]ARC86542.1 SsrA-binding protein [Clostridium argentinense]KIE46810.1 SsrA-binding protein [Clostridium argentinense CDC 2741]NFF38005.1 SsrA-binding protein SmpB [Clostridium argentinense]NFP49987.1 SsrA-binding protein SmpB [Clostridium argentinense]NFP71397.1 SsrA-binding protein SmpB [Clostridium argentinense]
MAKKLGNKTLVENRKARHDYFIEEAMEAGIALVGTEVKSIRAGKANLRDSYADIKNGEVFIKNMHISPYEQGNIFNKNPLRERKLLLHKYEIEKLLGYTAQKGYTLVPLSLYLKDGKVKVNLAVVRGKKDYDKRDAMLEKAAKRDIDRQMKEKYR